MLNRNRETHIIITENNRKLKKEEEIGRNWASSPLEDCFLYAWSIYINGKITDHDSLNWVNHIYYRHYTIFLKSILTWVYRTRPIEAVGPRRSKVWVQLNEAQVNTDGRYGSTWSIKKSHPTHHPRPPSLATNIIIQSFQELYFYFKIKSNIVYMIWIQRTEVLVSQHS